MTTTRLRRSPAPNLAAHPFLYAGEFQNQHGDYFDDQKVYLVKGGKVAWTKVFVIDNSKNPKAKRFDEKIGSVRVWELPTTGTDAHAMFRQCRMTRSSSLLVAHINMAKDPAKDLVVHGLSRCVRNPMYVGVLLVLLAVKREAMLQVFVANLPLSSEGGRSRHPRFESATLDMSNQEF
jgi:hypothetical protein